MVLGLWNRLAVVAAVLFSLAAPTWIVLSENRKNAIRNEEGYSGCIAQVRSPGTDLTFETCREIWLTQVPRLGWEDWYPLVGLFAVFAAVIYGVIWLSVWIAKWILRGRNQTV